MPFLLNQRGAQRCLAMVPQDERGGICFACKGNHSIAQDRFTDSFIPPDPFRPHYKVKWKFAQLHLPDLVDIRWWTSTSNHDRSTDSMRFTKRILRHHSLRFHNPGTSTNGVHFHNPGTSNNGLRFPNSGTSSDGLRFPNPGTFTKRGAFL